MGGGEGNQVQRINLSTSKSERQEKESCLNWVSDNESYKYMFWNHYVYIKHIPMFSSNE